MSAKEHALANSGAALYQHCGTCNIEKNLLRCASCKMIQYCSKEHQAAHWPEHKSACKTIRKGATQLEREEKDLRADPEGDPFLTEAGHFWKLLETRDYMRARYGLVDAILEVKTFDAAESALHHLMDMLRLCRGDNMGVRSQVPALFLRLGKDQECYDFVKWWTTTGQDSHYDWGDTSNPYLDTKNADIFEPVDLFCRKYLDLSHTVALTLLKLRSYLAIKKALQNVAVLRESGALPTELFDHVQSSLLRDVLGGKWDDTSSAKCSQLADTLASHVEQLYAAVKGANKHFWPALLNPDKHLQGLPGGYTHGSVQEMQLVLRYSIDSWRESPGALEQLATKR